MPNFDLDDDDFLPNDEPLWEERHNDRRLIVRTTKKINPKKPTLVLVGEHMIDPTDVACIKKVKSKENLYVIVMKSQPNMEFPMWANGSEVEELIKHFNIVG